MDSLITESNISNTTPDLPVDDMKAMVKEFTNAKRSEIKVMFIAIGDLENKAMTRDIKKDRKVHEVQSWLKKEHGLAKSDNLNIFICDSF